MIMLERVYAADYYFFLGEFAREVAPQLTEESEAKDWDVAVNAGSFYFSLIHNLKEGNFIIFD